MKKSVVVFFVIFFMQLLILSCRSHQSLNQCKYYHDLAISEYENGNSERAYQFVCKSLELYDSLQKNDFPLLAELKHDVAVMSLYDYSNVDAFVTNIEEAINIKHQLYGESTDYHWSVECYADGLLKLSFHQELPYNIYTLESAKEQYEKIPNYEYFENYGLCLIHLAESYEGVNINKSIEYGLNCLTIKRMTNDPDTLSILSNLGEYYKECGDFQRAKACLKSVLMSENQGDENLIINTNIRLASLYGRIGVCDSAYFYSERARLMEQDVYGSNTTRYATSMMNSGLYKFVGGEIDCGINLLKLAYNHPKCDKRNILFNLAGVYSKKGEPDSCYKYLHEAWVEIKNEVSNTLQNLSKEDQYSYLIQESTYKLVTSPVNYYLQHEDHIGLRTLAYNCILYYKNLSMQSMWNIASTSSIESQLDLISHSLDTNEVAIETWRDLSGSWYGDYILAFIIKSGDANLSVVKLSRDAIIKTLLNEITASSTYLPLYENIWKDIITAIDLPRNGHVYMVCDDILSQIPIESICDYNWEYIGDKYAISRISSTASIPTLKNDTIGSTIALYGGLKYDCNTNNYIGDTLLTEIRSGYKYLPWTKEEVVKIKGICDSTNKISDVTIYTDVNGTEEAVISLSHNSPSIIHFATHGFFLQPTIDMDWYQYYTFCMKNAGLLLSCPSDENEDGFLNAAEIRLLDLNNTDLVVLSACNTGKGGITPWGIVGLQNAFKAAGVNTIVMTIGEVDDIATSLFMENFYRGLFDGMTKREAFKQAQLCLRENEYFGEFNYWASFIMLD